MIKSLIGAAMLVSSNTSVNYDLYNTLTFACIESTGFHSFSSDAQNLIIDSCSDSSIQLLIEQNKIFK